jgi:hypothetical protein
MVTRFAFADWPFRSFAFADWPFWSIAFGDDFRKKIIGGCWIKHCGAVCIAFALIIDFICRLAVPVDCICSYNRLHLQIGRSGRLHLLL